MREREFTTEFVRRNTISGCFEIKFTSKQSIPFKAVQPHQEQALLAAAGGQGLSWKISDSPFFKDPKGRMRFTHKKNFDVVRLANTPAYIVLVFWAPRKKKMVYYITIHDWIEMRKNADRKSVTEKAAAEYSDMIEDYTK